MGPYQFAVESTAMNARSQSIRRDLILRMAVAALVLTMIVGTATYIVERQRIATAIEERTVLGVELLRARVRHLAQSTGEPWQEVVPEALVGLAEDMPSIELGRFVYVQILDTHGRQLASYSPKQEAASLTQLVTLVSQRGFKANPEHLELRRIPDSPIPGAVAVAIPVGDRQGARVAQINGVFVVSAKTIAEFNRRLAIAVLTVMAIVAVTTLLIYPIIRHLIHRLSDLSIQLLDANLETLQVLGDAIAKRDSDTDAHNYRVTIYSVHLAETSAVDNTVIRRLIKGAFLHDVGKIGVRDHILLKPGRLTDEEFEIMKTHVSHGMDIIERSDWLRDAGELIGSHHEQFAGKGYYHGLKGESIPLTARIFAIADVFDALTSERPYKKPLTVEESIEILKRGTGLHFDPDLVERFTAIAPSLHGRFANDYEAARKELAEILQRYFKTDLSIILNEAFTGK